MKKKLTALFIGLALTATVFGCNKETGSDITSMNMSKYMTLGDYKGLTVEYNLAEVTDEALEEQIKSMLIANSEKIALLEGTAKNGDLVNINYVGYKDDVPFDGGTANSQNIRIGAGNYIPGFEEAIIGMAPGETKDANMTFPADYHSEELAGQDVVFAITLNYIYPEITDEVVASMENSKYGTKEEFMAYAEEIVRNDAESSNSSNVTALAFEKILENAEYKNIPDSILQEEGIAVTDEELDARLNEVAENFGTDPETYLSMNEITREKFRELMISEKVQQFVYENTTAVPYGQAE